MKQDEQLSVIIATLLEKMGVDEIELEKTHLDKVHKDNTYIGISIESEGKTVRIKRIKNNIADRLKELFK